MKSSNKSSGLGLASTLFLIFLVLKLTKVIKWSWLWVFSPLWIICLIWAIIALIIVIYSFNKKE